MSVTERVALLQAGLRQHRGRALVLGVSALSARDALHAAVMARNGIELIMTFDTAFDVVPGISRFRA